MGAVPRVAAEGRMARLCAIACLGLAQGAALGIVAFATRAAFGAMAAGGAPSAATLALLLAGGVGVVGLRLAARVLAEAVGQHFAASLRHRLYAHIAGMSRSDLAARRVGGLSLRFVGDLSAARAWAGGGVAQALPALAVVPGAALALVLLQPALAVAAMVPMVLALAVAVTLATGLGGRHLRLRRNRARIASSMMERVALAPDLDLAGRTRTELRRLDDAGETLAHEAVTRRWRSETLRALPHLGAALGGAAVIWTAAARALPTAETAATLAILAILAAPLADLAGIWDRWCAWRIARTACERLFAAPSELRSITSARAAVPVRFDGRTPPGRRITLNIPAGSLALIAGPQGAGKSTLARLIAAQDRPREGTVTYDPARAGLPRIAYVGPAPLILKGSLRRALTLGISPRPDPRRIHSVAREYGLDRLLDRVRSTNAKLAEGEGGLSTREQLALGLARAALMRPDLIVIDHPALGPKDATLIRKLHARTAATLVLTGDPAAFPEADQVLELSAAPDHD